MSNRHYILIQKFQKQHIMSRKKENTPPPSPQEPENKESGCLKNWEQDLKDISNELLGVCAKKKPIRTSL